MVEINLFHANETNKIDDFLKNKKLKLSSHPKDYQWFGKGMYFWDNKGNAIFWKNNIDKKCKYKIDSKILKITFSFDEDQLLDLTDYHILDTMNHLLECTKKMRLILILLEKN